MQSLLKTKTFWVGIAAIFTAIGTYVSGEINLGQFIQALIIGVLAITGRQAVLKVRSPLWFVPLLLFTQGCAMLDPGGQVNRALDQRKTYEWSADGTVKVYGEGSQEERFTMAQGVLKLKEGEDGQPVLDIENSTLEYYLTADPSADAATAALAEAFKAATTQAEILRDVVGKVLDFVGPLLPGAGEAKQPEEILEILPP